MPSGGEPRGLVISTPTSGEAWAGTRLPGSAPPPSCATLGADREKTHFLGQAQGLKSQWAEGTGGQPALKAPGR